MTAYFLDSSALVKRYVAEMGTLWIQGISAPDARNALIIARVAWVEVLSALARRQREGKLLPDSASATAVVRAFRFDLDTQYQVVELDRVVTDTAGRLVGRYPLRAYDAVQLASALRVQPAFLHTHAPLVFLSADEHLLAVAQAEGLATDDPNAHP